MKKQENYPPGWDEARVRRVLAHYEEQTEVEAVAEDEAAFENRTQTAMEVPIELVPVVRQLIAEHRLVNFAGLKESYVHDVIIMKEAPNYWVD